MEVSACDELVRLSQPTLCLSSTQLDLVAKLAEVSKEFMQMRARLFVQNRLESPIAEIILQDATPLRTCTVHRAITDDKALDVTRRGKKCREFLSQRVFLLDHLNSRMVLFTEPREMTSKTAAAHHVAGTELWSGARCHGHTGLLISHGCWDRAMMTACARFQQQRAHAFRFHDEANLKTDPGDVELKLLLHWTTSAGCSAHDFTNSLRWSNFKDFGNRDKMRRVWIVIESLRSSLDQLIGNLGAWLGQCLFFKDMRSGVRLQDLWQLLGLPEKLRNEFSELELRFEDGLVCVAFRFKDDVGLPQRVANCFLYLFQFRSWSDTRWAAVGKACRLLLACELIGLSFLVAFIRAAPGESSYYIDGFKHLDQDILRLVTVCACSARVSEQPLQMILKDDRLPRLLPRIDECIASELAYATSID